MTLQFIAELSNEELAAELKPRDVIKLDERYGPAAVEDLLGIPESRVLEAIRNQPSGNCDPATGVPIHGDAVNFIENVFGSFRHLHPTEIKVSGRALLEWIERARITYAITAHGAQSFRQAHPELDRRRPDLVEQAAAAREARHRAEEQAARQRAAEAIEQARDRLVEILCRIDTPEEGDAAELTDLMDMLDLDEAAVRKAVQALHKMQEIHAAAEKTAEAQDTFKAAQQEHERLLREFRERHADELAVVQAAETRANAARGAVGRCENMKLLQDRADGLQRRFPWLFHREPGLLPTVR